MIGCRAWCVPTAGGRQSSAPAGSSGDGTRPRGGGGRGPTRLRHASAELLPILGPSAEGLSGQRTTEKESLSEIAAAKSDELELFVGFDALADDANAQAMRHGDDRLDHRRVSRVARDVEDERLVDLDGVHRQLFQVAEAGIARTKVVEGQTNAQSVQRVQCCV